MAKWPRFDPDADRRLVGALSEGTEEPLAALYDIYAERLRDYCGSLTRDRRVATDIIHDTLIDASRRVRRMRDRVRLRAWLYAAVRRRCLQRVRHPALRWEFGGDAIDEEARELLEAAFDRLDFVDQEALLLALRHDLDGEDLGALLGIPARRATTRIARAQARAESALGTAQRTAARRCAAGDRTDPRTEPEAGIEAGAEPAAEAAPESEADSADADSADRSAPAAREPAARLRIRSMSDAAVTEHVAGCADCRRRRELSLAALLDLMPVPKLPVSLRHRVVHTGTDPELAGYRADIAARGGTLNADGLPRQPDIPSHFARRWLFTGGGMVGALVTAVIAAILIGPGTPIPDLIWPSVGPDPSDTPRMPPRRPPAQAQPPPTGAPGWPREAVPQAGGRRADEKRSPTPTAAGVLEVTPAAVALGRRERVAKVTLSAAGGPVTWQAVSSTNRITLSADDGRLAGGDKSVVTLTFRRGLLEIPGRETVTFTDSAGRTRTVAITWAGSLL
jgi:DNA-directed RNA polymerase specialized sigma24 family protein